MDHVEARYGNQLKYGKHQYEVLEQADGLIICTEWSAFRSPQFSAMFKSMCQHAIFDGRQCGSQKIRHGNWAKTTLCGDSLANGLGGKVDAADSTDAVGFAGEECAA